MATEVTNSVVNMGRGQGGVEQLDEILRDLRQTRMQRLDGTPVRAVVLTDAEYAALAVKEETVLYLTYTPA